MKIRQKLREIIPKQKRRDLIQWFVRNNTWYSKGLQVLSSFRVVEITDIAILMGVLKYLFGDNLSIAWVAVCAFMYYPGRTLTYWFIGKFWESNDGWDIHTKFNASRVEPGRMVIVNVDELAEKVASSIEL